MNILIKEQFAPYAEHFSACAVYFANIAAKSPKGEVITAVNADTGTPLGMAAFEYSFNEKMIGISYIYTLPLFRREGVGFALVEYILSKGIITTARHTVSGGESLAFDALMKKRGFGFIHNSYLFRAFSDKERTEEFKAYVRKSGKRLLLRGYGAAPFAECSAELLRDLEKRINNGDFPLNFNPFTDPVKYNPEASFLVFKDSVPIVYMANFTQNNDKNMQMKYLATAKEYLGTGVSVLTLYVLADYFDKKGWICEDIRFVVSIANTKMNAMLANRRLTGVVEKRGDLFKYYYPSE